MKKSFFVFIFLSAIFFSLNLMALTPMISTVPDVTLDMNTSSPVMSFTVSDNDNAPQDLTVTYDSSNTRLVPEDDAHIILGGYGTNRTIQIIPSPGRCGQSTIVITVTDLDGDSSQDASNVFVNCPPITS